MIRPFALYTDDTGVYPPELVLIDTAERQEYRYRFPCERCSVVDTGEGYSYLVPYGFHERTDLPNPRGHYREWFDESLADVARSVGVTRADLVADLTSDDPRRLASAYEAIAGYHGKDNFDSYPQIRNLDGENDDVWDGDVAGICDGTP